MSQQEESPSTDYPLGRGYGHDYMRGGEVFGGYGYAQREEYELRRGDTGEFRVQTETHPESDQGHVS